MPGLDIDQLQSKEVVLLLEVFPKEEVVGATVHSGNAYKYGFSRFVAETNVTTGKLFREITGVYHNSVALTEVNSIAEVISAPPTWYFDSANSMLYLHLTGGVDPADEASVAVEFKLRFSTIGRSFNGYYYEPRISSDQLPELREELEDMFFGVIKKIGSGEISMSNDDGLFDILSRLYVWKNSTVKLYYGGDDMAYASYLQVGEYLIEDMTPGFAVMKLFVRDVAKRLLRLLPITPMLKTHDPDDGTDASIDFPDMDSSYDGKFMPIIYGLVESVPAIRIIGTGSTGSANTYLLADYNYQSLYSIDWVGNDDVTVDPSFLSLSPSGCTFAITSGYTYSIGTVTANVKGVPIQGNPWETSTLYLESGAEICADFMTRFCAITAAQITASTFVDVDSLVLQPQFLYIGPGAQNTARTYIRDLERGILMRIIRGGDGRFNASVWEPSSAVAGLVSVYDYDVGAVEPDLRIESIFSKVIVKFDNTPETTNWRIAIRSNERAKHLYLGGEHVERVISTNLVSTTDAGRLGERMLYISKTPELFMRIVDVGTKLMSVSPGDRILLTMDRAPSQFGYWDEQLMEVISVARKFNPPSVEIVVSDMHGLGNTMGNWRIASFPDYSAATEEEMEVSGFWLDSLDTPDGSTPFESIWW